MTIKKHIISLLVAGAVMLQSIPVQIPAGAAVMDETIFFSKLNYSAYSGLSQVESAVKKKDYDLAKEELLKYYQNRKKAGTVKAFAITEEDANPGMADLALDNILTGPYEFDVKIGMFTVNGIGEDNAQVCTADVTEKTAEELSNGNLSVMLFERQKQNDSVVVKTKESGDAPTLTIRTKEGNTYKIEADNDTYVHSGKPQNTFGSEEVMYINEQSNDVDNAIGSQTRRAYINFPLEGNVKKETIVSAVLSCKAYVEEGCDTGSKDVYIISIGDTTWSENTLKWSGIGGSIYSWQDNETGPAWNAPSGCDSEYLNVTTRFWFGRAMAYEYLKYIDDPTGYPEGEQYGGKLLFLMNAFTEKQDYGYCRTLETGERLNRWVDIIDALVDTPAMTPEIFYNLISFVWGDCNYLYGLAYGSMGWSNWKLVASAGYFKGTEYFPEFSTYSSFRADVESKVERCMSDLFNTGSDYSFTEAGMAYAQWCVELFGDCARMAELNRHPMSTAFKTKLKYATRYAMESFYPDGYDTNIGDSNYVNQMGSFKGLSELLEDDALNAYVNGGKEGNPDYLSSYYPTVNSAYMRNSWDPNEAVYVNFSSNPYDGHAHPDSNQVLMYAYGKPLLVDSGRYSYSTFNSIYDDLRAANAHNTIEAVGKQLRTYNNGWHYHSGSAQPFSYHKSNGAFDFNTSLQTGYSGSNIMHTRNVLYMQDGYAMVTDYVEGQDAAQEYRQNWHFMPSNNAAMTGQTAQTAFHKEANITIVNAGSDSAKIRDGYHSANYGLIANSEYASYGKTGTTVKFDTVLYPQKANQAAPNLTAIDLVPENTDMSAVKLEGDLDGVYYVKHTDASTGTFKDGNTTYVIDGKMFYTNGTDISIVDGKSAAKDGEVLIESDYSISSASVSVKNGVMNIYGEDLVAAQNAASAIKIKADGIKEVYLNEVKVALRTADGYVVSVATQAGEYNNCDLNVASASYNKVGNNLIPNSDFENGVEGWYTGNYTKAIVDGEDKITIAEEEDGNHILRLGAGVGTGANGALSTKFTITPGKQYYFAFDVRKELEGTRTATVFLELMNSSNIRTRTLAGSTPGVEGRDYIPAVSADWTRYEYVFTAASTEEQVGFKSGWNDDSRGDPIYYDNFELYEIGAVYEEESNVTINFVDGDGNQLKETETIQSASGTLYVYEAEQQITVDGQKYLLNESKSVLGVKVDANKVNSIKAVYEPAELVTVSFVNESNTKIAEDITEYAMAGNVYMYTPSAVIENNGIRYMLSGDTPLTCTVEQGSTNQLTAVYAPSAQVTVRFVNEEGDQLADEVTEYARIGKEFYYSAPTSIDADNKVYRIDGETLVEHVVSAKAEENIITVTYTGYKTKTVSVELSDSWTIRTSTNALEGTANGRIQFDGRSGNEKHGYVGLVLPDGMEVSAITGADLQLYAITGDATVGTATVYAKAYTDLEEYEADINTAVAMTTEVGTVDVTQYAYGSSTIDLSELLNDYSGAKAIIFKLINNAATNILCSGTDSIAVTADGWTAYAEYTAMCNLKVFIADDDEDDEQQEIVETQQMKVTDMCSWTWNAWDSKMEGEANARIQIDNRGDWYTKYGYLGFEIPDEIESVTNILSAAFQLYAIAGNVDSGAATVYAKAYTDLDEFEADKNTAADITTQVGSLAVTKLNYGTSSIDLSELLEENPNAKAIVFKLVNNGNSNILCVGTDSAAARTDNTGTNGAYAEYTPILTLEVRK